MGVPSTVIHELPNTLPRPRRMARNLVSECVVVYEVSRGLHREASSRAERFGPIRI